VKAVLFVQKHSRLITKSKRQRNYLNSWRHAVIKRWKISQDFFKNPNKGWNILESKNCICFTEDFTSLRLQRARHIIEDLLLSLFKKKKRILM